MSVVDPSQINMCSIACMNPTGGWDKVATPEAPMRRDDNGMKTTAPLWLQVPKGRCLAGDRRRQHLSRTTMMRTAIAEFLISVVEVAMDHESIQNTISFLGPLEWLFNKMKVLVQKILSTSCFAIGQCQTCTTQPNHPSFLLPNSKQWQHQVQVYFSLSITPSQRSCHIKFVLSTMVTVFCTSPLILSQELHGFIYMKQLRR